MTATSTSSPRPSGPGNTGSGTARAWPSWATPRTPSRHSDGPFVGELIARKLGRVTTPWQQDALDVALERVDGPGSPFAYDTIVIIVGRRAGKTVTTFGVPLARGLAGPLRLPGRAPLPFRAAHVAQNLPAAFKRFTEDLVAPYRESMSTLEWRRRANHFRNLANPSLTFDWRTAAPDVVGHADVSRIEVYSPRGDGLRGSAFGHVSFDEALVMSAVEAASLNSSMRPTLKTLQGHAQVWVTSNIATTTGRDRWLWQLRDQGRADVEAGRTHGRCYIEYSAPPDADIYDERVWWDYYPALHDGLVRPEDLRADLEAVDFGPQRFAAEYLGIWPDGDTAVSWLSIDEAVFTAAGTTDPMPDDTPAVIGVDIDPYGRSSTIQAATMRPDSDTAVIEVLDHRPGSGWVEDRVRELAPTIKAIGVDDYGPGHDLLQRLDDPAADSDLADKIVRTSGQSLYAACYAFDAALREERLQWVASDYHQALVDAAKTAQRTVGRAWQWERRVATTQTPLVAGTLALWALGHGPAPVPDSEIF